MCKYTRILKDNNVVICEMKNRGIGLHVPRQPSFVFFQTHILKNIFFLTKALIYIYKKETVFMADGVFNSNTTSLEFGLYDTDTPILTKCISNFVYYNKYY